MTPELALIILGACKICVGVRAAIFIRSTFFFNLTISLFSALVMTMSFAKRRSDPASQPPHKKLKTNHLTASELPWKLVPTPKEAGIGNDLDGILELEEVDDVEVVYEQTDGGKVVRFNVSKVMSCERGLLLIV